MGKSFAKLTALQVENLAKPGQYGDGRGLCLQINAMVYDIARRPSRSNSALSRTACGFDVVSRRSP